ncbi:MAG: hypothetical protein WEB04_12255 [Dehalococcoidia bacterium]
MNITKRLGLGLAIVAAAVLAVVAISQVSASFDNIIMERATVEPNHEATVDLLADDIDDPGLGAWEIGIIYNPAIVSVNANSCVGHNGSVCNPMFASNQVRVVGASTNGFNDGSLASITFRCGSTTGTSPLTLVIDVIADATEFEPQPLDVKQFDGSITCTDSPFSTPPPGSTPQPTEPGSQAAATPTLPVTGVADTGFGDEANSGSLSWLIAGLSAAGLAAISGATVVAIRRRSDD